MPQQEPYMEKRGLLLCTRVEDDGGAEKTEIT